DAFKGDDNGQLPLHDRWILSRLNRTARTLDKALSEYQFHEAVQTLYHFFWDDFCDWYIELTKMEVAAEQPSATRDRARSRLVTVLEQALRLLHPFMPYITEELWQRLPGAGAGLLHPAYKGAHPTIMLTSYPRPDESLIDERVEREMSAVIELISRVRNIRSELNVKPGMRVRVLLGASDEQLRDVFNANRDQIARLARASDISINERLDAPRASARAVLAGGAEVAVPLEGLIDFAQERERLGREREKLQKEAAKLEAQLANPQFAERAPAEKVNEIRERLADIQRRDAALQQMSEALR
ncbi:MAG: class I tRNA ligase family protein, partial [Acidobacteriota bacterium]|nr:class I tRNA ligase family protein [Acidobacteriota bacterium]